LRFAGYSIVCDGDAVFWCESSEDFEKLVLALTASGMKVLLQADGKWLFF
jgi:hypothetical protein